MNTIGNISSIVTLILFIAYFIGRIWTLVKDSKYPGLNMTVDFNQSLSDYDTFDLDLNGNEIVIAKFSQNIRWIKIMEIEWTDNYDKYKTIKEKAKVQYIPENKEITICTNVPEGTPN